MKKDRFLKMLVLTVAIIGATMMSNQAFARGVDGLLTSTNSESLNNVTESENEAVASSLTRNNVQYEILEQPGKMIMVYSEDIVTMSYVNFEKTKVAFRLIDAEGNLLFSQTGKKAMFHQRVKTENLPAGDYTAVFFSADDYYEKEFSISR